MPEPLAQHVWEITVQLPNGDWEYMRTMARVTFHEAVDMALAFADAGKRPIVSIINVDHADVRAGALRAASKLDLDVDAPDKVAGVLRVAAEAYSASSTELAAAWQDDRSPMIWASIASCLDTAAGMVEMRVKKHFDMTAARVQRRKN